MKRLALVPLLLVLACAKVSLTTTCPPGTIGVGFALAGSTVGNTLLSMIGTAVAAGKGGTGLPRNADGTPAPTQSPAPSTMTYDYLPIFGADSGTLTCTQPIAQPSPVVVTTGPPAAILH